MSGTQWPNAMLGNFLEISGKDLKDPGGVTLFKNGHDAVAVFIRALP